MLAVYSVRFAIGASSVPLLSYAKYFKDGVRCFSACVQHNRNSVEETRSNSLVESLSEALNGIPPSSCGRQMAELRC